MWGCFGAGGHYENRTPKIKGWTHKQETHLRGGIFGTPNEESFVFASQHVCPIGTHAVILGQLPSAQTAGLVNCNPDRSFFV